MNFSFSIEDDPDQVILSIKKFKDNLINQIKKERNLHDSFIVYNIKYFIDFSVNFNIFDKIDTLRFKGLKALIIYYLFQFLSEPKIINFIKKNERFKLIINEKIVEFKRDINSLNFTEKEDLIKLLNDVENQLKFSETDFLIDNLFEEDEEIE